MLEEFGLLFVVTGGAEPTSERLGLMLALSPEGMSAPGGASPGIRPQVLISLFLLSFPVLSLLSGMGRHVSEGSERTFIWRGT